jgi:hypothetical protein
VGIKRPGHEADHSPPSSAEVNERVELYIHSPNTPTWRGAQLKEAQGIARTKQNSIMIKLSIPAVGSNEPPIQSAPGALSLGVKRPEREADHSPPSSAEVKFSWSYTSTPPVPLHGVVLG